MTANTGTPNAAEDAAEGLHARLVDTLRDQGHVTDDQVEAALRAVPRHRFVPHAAVRDAYANGTVHTKCDAAGQAVSCASQPCIVAMMLHQLDIQPGHRVLEIGTGTGYNSALLAHLTGPEGQVATIDVDPGITRDARAHLEAAGIGTVDVLCGDGARGHPDRAPYDRIIATVGAHDVPAAWRDQLATGGRLVVPVRIAGDASRSIAFERQRDHWASVDAQMCTFVPLRDSIGADPRRVLDLAPEGAVRLQANQDQRIHAEALHGVLTEDKGEVWTGVRFGGNESFGEMWLWLACALDNSLSRMPVTPEATASGLVAPMLRWGSMASVPAGERGLAYLTQRPAGPEGEIGVIGHAPAGRALAETMAREITAWDASHRPHTAGFTLHPSPHGSASQARPGRFILDRPTARLAVTWRQ